SASGLAVLTAQNPQARVQRSPAIMNVAVPLLQHSQWVGHFALSQTVCSLSSSSNERVRENVSEVGSVMRSHSGRRGRGFKSVAIIFTSTDYTDFRRNKMRNKIICANQRNLRISFLRKSFSKIVPILPARNRREFFRPRQSLVRASGRK